MAEANIPSPALRLEGIGFAFGNVPVLWDINLRLAAGTFLSLLGPSGGGKTTLLKLIGGYLRPTKGQIFLHERDVTSRPPERRDIGMVFQNYALFPHLTARANVSFGLEMRRVPKAERQRRVESMLDRVGLTAAERNRRPAQLSGGQQQRVALARALVIEPLLLLLDEPLANLDRELREQLRSELKELQRRSGVTTLLVTHDRDEALTLADRVGVLGAGRLLQVGAPEEVYQRPHCPFVARLLGDANLFLVESVESGLVLLDGGLPLRPTLGEGINWRVGDRVMVRPEHCRLTTEDKAKDRGWSGHVTAVHYLGCDQIVDVAVRQERIVRVRQRAGSSPAISPGTLVGVAVAPDAWWRLPEADPAWLSFVPKDAADVRL
jgi:ABC-type Fe3+/spermidine/putrescine transport system ATPase subunit